MADSLTVQEIQASISYLYILSFCPPDQIHALAQAGLPLRSGLALQADLPEAEFFARTIPESCRRITAFHQRLPIPDQKLKNDLSRAAQTAQESPEAAYLFQQQMDRICSLPSRTEKNKRLRPSRGCQFCQAPCRYGFFVLVSRPEYTLLQKLLEQHENSRDPGGTLKATWSFTTSHLWRTLGTRQGYISPYHLGNLSYCLLVLAMAKSRLPFPESELASFQEWNQALIAGWPANAAHV
ncbi:MAG: hypothetical protein JXA25_10125 [Anaerolineales bacterium]|nr:hypothetical protein [Anaerolineales bacterium]